MLPHELPTFHPRYSTSRHLPSGPAFRNLSPDNSGVEYVECRGDRIELSTRRQFLKLAEHALDHIVDIRKILTEPSRS
jgi:hypothetical protein